MSPCCDGLAHPQPEFLVVAGTGTAVGRSVGVVYKTRLLAVAAASVRNGYIRVPVGVVSATVPAIDAGACTTPAVALNVVGIERGGVSRHKAHAGRYIKAVVVGIVLIAAAARVKVIVLKIGVVGSVRNSSIGVASQGIDYRIGILGRSSGQAG